MVQSLELSVHRASVACVAVPRVDEPGALCRQNRMNKEEVMRISLLLAGPGQSDPQLWQGVHACQTDAFRRSAYARCPSL